MRLDRRRARNDLLEAFKIINGHYDIASDTFLNLMTVTGRNKKLFKRRSKLDIRNYVFANRIVDKWNVCLTVAWNALQ